MKLLCDVNISPAVVALLAADGFDVQRVGSGVLDPRAPDGAILDEARRLGAALISRDQDFSALLATTGATGPSLVNVRLSSVDSAELARKIAAAVRATTVELAAGVIVTLDDASVRLHSLPVS